MPTDHARVDSLRDIVKHCDQVDSFLRGLTMEAFSKDTKTYNATLYSLQTVGEAAIRLDKEERRLGDRGLMERLYPEVSWPDVRGLSNIIRHVYDDLKIELI